MVAAMDNKWTRFYTARYVNKLPPNPDCEIEQMVERMLDREGVDELINAMLVEADYQREAIKEIMQRESLRPGSTEN